VTARHAGQVRPSDTWLADQLEGWLAEYDGETAKILAQLRERTGSKSSEQLFAELLDRDEVKTRLLCKARLLIAEALR
jgi:hypothetical protein